MKKLTKIFALFFIPALVAATFSTVSAQRGYRGYRGSYARINRGSYGYRPVVNTYRYMHTPRYVSYPRASLSVTSGGNPYFYSGGFFYRPYGHFYRPVIPPIGIRIGILPVGYIPIFVGPNQYYFYNGTYYKRYNNDNYEVVDAPMGAELATLPRQAKSVVLNGEKFYELNGTYYKEDRNYKGQTVYTVVGKNGKIDNTEEPAADTATPQVGDKVMQLPENCKTITLNDQKLYVAPDDTYYQAETDGTFTVVGIAK